MARRVLLRTMAQKRSAPPDDITPERRIFPYRGSCDLEGPASVLTWRQDPEVSLSDWKLSVKIIGGSEATQYFIHRNVLGAGQRMSQYFVRLFRGCGKFMQEAGTRTTDLELEGSTDL